MLRTRRRDNNVKPNRRLDRKSSRGMIYENEELRLKTININAEIERGQYDIKKLKRENELLKKEIWCLRDEYEKLDKLLKDKEMELSSSSATSSSGEEDNQPHQESTTASCTSSNGQTTTETTLNSPNVTKDSLTPTFDNLSIVHEEDDVVTIRPDQCYPDSQRPDYQNRSIWMNEMSVFRPIDDNDKLSPTVNVIGFESVTPTTTTKKSLFTKVKKRLKKQDDVNTMTLPVPEPPPSRERSLSACSDRPTSFVFNPYEEQRQQEHSDYSDGESCNSYGSNNKEGVGGTTTRKLSLMSTDNDDGKVPWCGCWGNGCI